MREEILRAADHIEQRPSDYCFMSVALPSPGRTAGCALGWVAYFLRDFLEPGAPPVREAVTLLGVSSEQEFYDRLDSYNPGYKWGETWTTSAQVCANSLRAYVAEFFPG
jgi:hypothetical protein